MVEQVNTVKYSNWFRFLLVTGTLLLAMVAIVPGMLIALLADFDPRHLQGGSFELGWMTASLFLSYQVLVSLLVYVAYTRILKRPFASLGFRSPVVRNLCLGFGAAVTLKFLVLAIFALLGDGVSLSVSFPAGLTLTAWLPYYLFFFFIFLTANSFGEELVYRCFPMEVFRGQPLALVLIMAWSALIFAALHFMIGTADLYWFLYLLGGAALFATVYYCSRSIWLVVGLHSGLNFYALSFGGNWKMGGLLELSGTLPAASTRLIIELLAFLVASILVLYLHWRPVVWNLSGRSTRSSD